VSISMLHSINVKERRGVDLRSLPKDWIVDSISWLLIFRQDIVRLRSVG
jgi:hypothetical protein